MGGSAIFKWSTVHGDRNCYLVYNLYFDRCRLSATCGDGWQWHPPAVLPAEISLLTPGVITKAHWDALAVQCDVKSRFLGNLVEQTATPLVKKLIPVKKAFEARFGAYPALQRIEHIVTTQCQRAAGM